MLKYYPERSVDIYTDGTLDRWYIDPIALISKIPRLELGFLYSREESGKFACVTVLRILDP